MAEYIEREAALKAIERYGTTHGSNLGRHSGAVDLAILEIEYLPAADVAPVVHGRWLTWEEQFPEKIPTRKNNLGVFCEKCHNHNDNMTDYCPNCGAKMDKEGDNAKDWQYRNF